LRGFNPRAREGRDGAQRHRGKNSSVSIHAPARGATADSWYRCQILRVSIHAPARGATFRQMKHLSLNSCFNPRAREGRDAFIVTDYK
jgi:hypothetical protein